MKKTEIKKFFKENPEVIKDFVKGKIDNYELNSKLNFKKEFFLQKDNKFCIILKEINNYEYLYIEGSLKNGDLIINNSSSFVKEDEILFKIIVFFINREITSDLLYETYKELFRFFKLQDIFTKKDCLTQKFKEFEKHCGNYGVFLTNAYKLSFFKEILEFIEIMFFVY